MKPLFLGNHPALDFLNTSLYSRGKRFDLISDGQSFVAWLVDAAFLDPSTASKIKRRFDREALDAAASEAGTLREWVGDWISRWRNAPGADYRIEVRRLNRLLERARSYQEAVYTKNNMKLFERCHFDTADELIALVTEQVALLLTSESPALVKRCAGAGCTLWFLDRTKAHGRMFCSSRVCGNRAKVAAFRDRQRRRAK
jgi:predicted RNA-binding Zn ribbon-like protein